MGFSARTIAKRINRHHSSVARELKRLSETLHYKAETAQADYGIKRINSRPKGKYSSELSCLLKEKIEQTWSPE